jgi:hypothetical protein
VCNSSSPTHRISKSSIAVGIDSGTALMIISRGQSSGWPGRVRVLRDDGLLSCFGQPGKREDAFLHLMSEAPRRWQFHDLITWDRFLSRGFPDVALG